jgi:hypothetical protein
VEHLLIRHLCVLAQEVHDGRPAAQRLERDARVLCRLRHEWLEIHGDRRRVAGEDGLLLTTG